MLVANHDELRIGELPELGIVPAEDILFHEEPDIERVAKLIDQFSADGILKNPPIVARVENNSKRILLDGANRVTALTKLAFTDVLVQEIKLHDPGLVISQWHHAVENLSKQEIISHIDKIDGLIRKEAKPGTSEEDVICQIVFADETRTTLLASGDVFQKVDLLKRFTDVYHKLSLMDRVSYTNMNHLKKNYVNFAALVTFRLFSKEEIIQLSNAHIRVPSGVTRVLLPKRALNFNLHLDILKAELSLDEKNEWLRETIRNKILQKSIRFYREPTFFFDE